MNDSCEIMIDDEPVVFFYNEKINGRRSVSLSIDKYGLFDIVRKKELEPEDDCVDSNHQITIVENQNGEVSLIDSRTYKPICMLKDLLMLKSVPMTIATH